MPSKSYEHSTTPSDDVLTKAATLDVLDQSGERVRFGSLFEGQKTIIVFIRHFGCARCQDYCTALNKVRSDALDAAGTPLIIIGCGQPELIPAYYENTGLRTTVPIYAEPTRKLYQLLELTDNLDMPGSNDPKRSYYTDSFVQSVWKTLARASWSRPSHLLKNGRFSQNGGEFILGPGLKCSFGHRMKTTADHLDVEDLMKEAGVAYP